MTLLKITNILGCLLTTANSAALRGAHPDWATLANIYQASVASSTPSGTYEGSTSILGLKVEGSIVIESESLLDLSITTSTGVSIVCPSEAYTIDDSGVISLTDVGTDGDCAHDALADNKVSLESITYSSSTDDIDVKVAYKTLTVEIDLDHVSAVALATQPSLEQAYNTYFHAMSSQEPDGTYAGSVSVLGLSISATAVFTSDTSMAVTLTGAVSLSCPEEAYTYDSGSGEVSITNIETEGDCAHDALEENNVSWDSMTYSGTQDELTVVVTYSKKLPVTLTLTKQSSSSGAQSLALIYDTYSRYVVGSTPSGTYAGSETVMGISVAATLTFTSDTELAITISGVVDLDCDSEAYTIDSDAITITNVDQDGDCAHDALADNHVSLDSITYQESSDSVKVKVTYSKKLPVTLTLTKTSSVLASA